MHWGPPRCPAAAPTARRYPPPQPHPQLPPHARQVQPQPGLPRRPATRPPYHSAVGGREGGPLPPASNPPPRPPLPRPPLPLPAPDDDMVKLPKPLPEPPPKLMPYSSTRSSLPVISNREEVLFSTLRFLEATISLIVGTFLKPVPFFKFCTIVSLTSITAIAVCAVALDNNESNTSCCVLPPDIIIINKYIYF